MPPIADLEDSKEGESAARARAAPQGRLTDRCVSVVLGGSSYGIAIQYVQEIIAWRPLTRVFRAPLAIAGVTSLRGEILAVLDLGVLVGVPAENRLAPDANARIVVVREDEGARRRAGLRVDAVGPVRDLPRGIAGLDPVPSTVDPRTRMFVRGVISEAPLCAVLDVAALLDAPELLPLSGRVAEPA